MVSWIFVAPKLPVSELTQRVAARRMWASGVSTPDCGGITDPFPVSFPPNDRQRDRQRHPPHDPTHRIFS